MSAQELLDATRFFGLYLCPRRYGITFAEQKWNNTSESDGLRKTSFFSKNFHDHATRLYLKFFFEYDSTLLPLKQIDMIIELKYLCPKLNTKGFKWHFSNSILYRKNICTFYTIFEINSADNP